MVMKNLPLTLVDDELFCRATCYNSVSSNSLKKYMELLCQKIENEMCLHLPTKFGIIFDGWSEGNDHYVTLFACYDENGKGVFPLLAFQPIPDYNASNETDYQVTAAAHK